MIFFQGRADIRETLLVPLKITPVKLMHPEAVKMEHAERNLSLLHALDERGRCLLVVIGRKRGRQPESEGPRRRQRRAAGQLRIFSHNILRVRSVEQIVFDSLARNRKSYVLNLLAGNLKRYPVRAVHENAIPVIRHIERHALIGNLGGRASVLIPGIHRLPVFDKGCKPLAKTVYTLAHLQGQLADHIRLILLAHIVVCRKHCTLLAVPSHIAEITESAAGQNFSVRLKCIGKILSLHANLYLSRVQNRLSLIYGHTDIFIDSLFLLKAGNAVVICLIMPCLHGNRIRRMRHKLNGNRRQIQRCPTALDLFRRRQNPHTSRNLFHFIRLHCVGCIRLLAWQPVTFRKFHTIFSFHTDVSVFPQQRFSILNGRFSDTPNVSHFSL